MSEFQDWKAKWVTACVDGVGSLPVNGMFMTPDCKGWQRARAVLAEMLGTNADGLVGWQYIETCGGQHRFRLRCQGPNEWRGVDVRADDFELLCPHVC